MTGGLLRNARNDVFTRNDERKLVSEDALAAAHHGHCRPHPAPWVAC